MINFPIAPTLNEQYTEGDRTWKCVKVPPNAVWDIVPVSTSDAEGAAASAAAALVSANAAAISEENAETAYEGSQDIWEDLQDILADGPVISVNGETGTVVLDKADIGLANVDNTSDATKPISTATQTALDGKEPTIASGTIAQYWRGDKTWRDFATDVRATVLTGFSTAVSTAVDATDTVLAAFGKLQAQMNLKAALASPALTGTPTAPTQSTSDDSTKIATTGWVRSAMSNIASAAGFVISVGAGPTGYVKFPSWLGSWIFQFGTSVGTTNGFSAYFITFPLTFPVGVWTATLTNGDAGAQLGNPLMASGGLGTSGMTVVWANGTGGVGGGISTRTNWFAIGN